MHQLDLAGFNCPLPVLKTKKYLANLNSGEQVTVITTDPASAQDLAEFCHKTGNQLITQQLDTERIITIIQRR